jgi:hypothetical protein
MTTKAQREELRRENRTWPLLLQEIPKATWPEFPDHKGEKIRVLRSRGFLVQVYLEQDGTRRLTVNRTDPLPNGMWKDGITWDELMEVKRQAGYGNALAIEFFPPDADIVNVAALRHLFIPTGKTLPEHWKNEKPT